MVFTCEGTVMLVSLVQLPKHPMGSVFTACGILTLATSLSAKAPSPIELMVSGSVTDVSPFQ